MAKKEIPNPNGKNGKPLKIELPFDEAIRAALETPPEGSEAEKPKSGRGARPGKQNAPTR